MLTTQQLYNRIKRAATAGLSATLALGVVVMVAPSVHAVTMSPTPQISFTFDDGLQSALSLAAPALQKYGYAGTNYVIPMCVGMTTAPNACKADSTHTYMTWAQIKSLQDTYGWEIGSHTQSHPLLASTDPTDQPAPLTEAQVTSELLDAQNNILANVGTKPMAFASPYGDYDPIGANVIAKVAKYYTSHRGFADKGYNIFPYNDYLLLDQPVQLDNGVATDNITVATAKTYIDTAIANNRWLILTFHDIVASGAGATGEYQYNVADLEAIAQYAQSKGMKGTNVTNGLAGNASGGNLMTGYTFDAPVNTVTTPVANTPAADTTASTTWTTDTPTGVSQDTTGKGDLNNGTNTVKMTGASTGALHLFSPLVPVANKAYVVKAFVNTQQFSVTSELAFYVDEYDANGNYVTSQYKRSLYDSASPNVVNGAGYPLTRMYTFEYIPTTTLNGVAVAVTKARLQVTATTGTGMTCYIDNIEWWAQDGSTTGAATKAGDVNGDNAVDALDLSSVLTNWNKTAATRAQGDLNSDTVVDALDLSTVLTNWGK